MRIVWGSLTREWRAHLLALGLLVALTSFLVSSTFGAGSIGAADVIEEALAPLDGAPAITVSTRLASDPDAQDALVRDVLGQELGAAVTVERSEVDSGTDTPFAEWDVTSLAVNAENVGDLVDVGERIRLALRGTDAVVRGVQVDDALTPQLAPIAETIPNLSLLSVVPALLLLVLAVVVVVQAAATLPRAREETLRILSARGVSRVRLALYGAGEALVVGGLGAAAGVALARLALSRWGGGPLAPQIVAGAALVLGLAAASAWYVSAATRRAGRSARITSAVLLLIVAVLTGVTLWRLVRNGLDLVSAPAIGLAALTGSLLALVIVVPLGVLLAGVSARTRGLAAPLAFRLAARRQGASAPAALLVALTVASIALAASFQGTEQATRARDVELDRGADVRLALPSAPAGQPGTAIEPFTELEGVADAIGVRVAPIVVGDEPATLVALPTENADGVVASDISGELASTPEGIELGDGPYTLDVTATMLEIEGQVPRVTVPVNLTGEAWTVGASGVVQRTTSTVRAMDLADEAGSVNLPIEVPDGAERLLGVGVTVELQDEQFLNEAPSMSEGDFQNLTVEEFDAKYQELMEDGYPGVYSPFVMQIDSISWAGTELDWSSTPGSDMGSAPHVIDGWFAGDWNSQMLMGAVQVSAEIDTTPIAAIASPDVAELLALDVGDTFGVTLDGPSWNFGLVGISSDIPAAGGSLAVLVDQNRLAEFLYANGRDGYGPSEVWLALDGTRSADDVIAAARELEPKAELVEINEDESLTSATTRWTFWAVAVAGVGLALVGLIALRLSESRQMTAESEVLRSLGTPARTIRSIHRGELYARAIPAALGGAAAGLLLGRFVLPALVVLANGTERAPVFGIAWLPLGIGLVLLAVALMIAARVRRRP